MTNYKNLLWIVYKIYLSSILLMCSETDSAFHRKPLNVGSLFLVALSYLDTYGIQPVHSNAQLSPI